MRRYRFFTLLLLVSWLLSACSGNNLIPATQEPTQAATATALTSTATPLPPTSTPTLVPTITPTPAGAWIGLTPASGKPGDTVQVDGYLPNGPSDADLKNVNYQTYATLCWGGCQDGLQDQGLQMTWSETDAGHFSLSFVAPMAPWLAEDGLHALSTGDYPVTLRYLDDSATTCATPISQKGCLYELLAGTPFHLAQAASGPACQNLTSCGSLILTPAQGAPGDTIQAKGWAPLLFMIDNAASGYSGYELALAPAGSGTASSANLFTVGQPVSQLPDGSFTASFQVPQTDSNGAALAAGAYQVVLQASGLVSSKGAPPVVLSPTAFAITAAPAWTQRQPETPLWIQPANSLILPSVTVDPSNPDRLAYCAPGKITVSQDAGKSWSAVSTAGVAALVDAAGYALDQQTAAAPVCAYITLDTSHSGSFYAVFPTSSKQYGAPPIFYMAFFTSDSGKTWQAVPTPPETGQDAPMVERFGGYWSDAKGVQAMYLGDAGVGEQQAPSTLVLQTTDGGKTWSAASLTCPASGPCLRWGAAASTITGMGAGLPQWVMASQDAGQTWQSTGQMDYLRALGPFELAALSANEAVLISGSATYPLLDTQDGGKSWRALALPAFPGAAQMVGLQILPDSSLVAMDTNSGAWYALPPAAQDWCKLGLTSSYAPVLFQAIGSKVWWFSPADQSLQSAALTAFACQP